MGQFGRRVPSPEAEIPAGNSQELEQASFRPAGERSAEVVGNPLVCEMPVALRPKPRGLLPVPPAVHEHVGREQERFISEHKANPDESAIKNMLDSLTLQYYYEGCDVAYRVTPEGVDVLAVGHEEIGRLVREADEQQRASIEIGQP